MIYFGESLLHVQFPDGSGLESKTGCYFIRGRRRINKLHFYSHKPLIDTRYSIEIKWDIVLNQRFVLLFH